MGKRNQRKGSFWVKKPLKYTDLVSAIDQAYLKLAALKSCYDLPPGSGLFFEVDQRTAHVGTPVEDLVAIELPEVVVNNPAKWAYLRAISKEGQEAAETRLKGQLRFDPLAKIILKIEFPPFVEIRLNFGFVRDLAKWGRLKQKNKTRRSRFFNKKGEIKNEHANPAKNRKPTSKSSTDHKHRERGPGAGSLRKGL